MTLQHLRNKKEQLPTNLLLSSIIVSSVKINQSQLFWQMLNKIAEVFHKLHAFPGCRISAI